MNYILKYFLNFKILLYESKTNIKAFAVIISFVFVTNAFAQQKTVTGNVTSNLNQQPIAGATVVVKGTNIATQTNGDGNFTVTVPNAKSTLLITNVGFEPIEVSAGTSSPLGVSLKATNTSLNEVVVTGYTSQAKKDITGSVAVVNVKELVANPGSNIQSLLQGRAAGVTVGTSGVPGTGANVRMHGYSTFGNNEPLYVVDGARVGSITELNPNDIESLQILKDASAASIYGSAAAGGCYHHYHKKGKIWPPKSYL
ncbi:MAG: TonB-dependent receptor plug domain-containing protein [Chitinophagaceae bacterium]